MELIVGARAAERGKEFFPGIGFAGAYDTIREALSAAKDFRGREPEERILLCLLPGVYEENLEITCSHLTLRGAGREQVKILGHLGAKEILEDGFKRGTFRTQTVFAHGEDICLEQLTIENDCGQGHEAGQGLALYADGDRFCCRDVALLAHQDTLFCGPLPPKEIEPGGFRGPLQFAPRINGRQYYEGCTIAGTVDFIFGSATAFFEGCEIFCLDQEREGQVGHVSAPSTPQGQSFGLVFSDCIIGGSAPASSVYLGRPWRDYGQAVFLHCEMGEPIRPEGWDDWGKELARRECFFAEHQSQGPKSDPSHRASFGRILSEEEAAMYGRDQVLGGWRPWEQK